MEYIGRIENDNLFFEKINNEIIIFGGGFWGKKVLEYLERSVAQYNTVMFCDKAAGTIGKTLRRRNVISVEDACRNHKDAIYMIMGTYDIEMAEQLLKQGITNIRFYIR